MACRTPSKSYTDMLQYAQKQILDTTSEPAIERLRRLLHCFSLDVPPDTSTSACDDDGGRPEDGGHEIDLNLVRTLCAEGIADELPALRASLWKLVLGFLPTDIFRWDAVLADAQNTYARFVDELLVDAELADAARAFASCSELGNEAMLEQENVAESSLQTLSQVLDQITKDVFRTHPELDFFERRIDGDHDKEPQTSRGWGEGDLPECTNIWEPCTHRDVLARILLVYAKLNPDVQYVQGMNELCAPLYYLFSQDPLNSERAETDAFFCFNILMADMQPAFVKALGDEENGMIGRVRRFSSLLEEKDSEVFQHLEAHEVQPSFYAVRWLLLMLTQDHAMPDILRLWDTLLSDLARPHPFLFYLCVAMVILIREALLAGDFSACLLLLREYPTLPVDKTLGLAWQLRSADLVPGRIADKHANQIQAKTAGSESASYQRGYRDAGSKLNRSAGRLCDGNGDAARGHDGIASSYGYFVLKCVVPPLADELRADMMPRTNSEVAVVPNWDCSQEPSGKLSRRKAQAGCLGGAVTNWLAAINNVFETKLQSATDTNSSEEQAIKVIGMNAAPGSDISQVYATVITSCEASVLRSEFARLRMCSDHVRVML